MNFYTQSFCWFLNLWKPTTHLLFSLLGLILLNWISSAALSKTFTFENEFSKQQPMFLPFHFALCSVTTGRRQEVTGYRLQHFEWGPGSQAYPLCSRELGWKHIRRCPYHLPPSAVSRRLQARFLKGCMGIQKRNIWRHRGWRRSWGRVCTQARALEDVIKERKKRTPTKTTGLDRE